MGLAVDVAAGGGGAPWPLRSPRPVSIRAPSPVPPSLLGDKLISLRDHKINLVTK